VKVKNLKNLQIEESPGQTTAGLTSANQLINLTDAVSFESSNTSSAVPELTVVAIEPLPSKIPECALPIANFRDVLHRSMRKQGKILDVLSKL
jgi:hypothetical protein